jgi:hypothetical protein
VENIKHVVTQLKINQIAENQLVVISQKMLYKSLIYFYIVMVLEQINQSTRLLVF